MRCGGGGAQDIWPNILQIQMIISYFLLENRHISLIFFTGILGNWKKHGLCHYFEHRAVTPLSWPGASPFVTLRRLLSTSPAQLRFHSWHLFTIPLSQSEWVSQWQSMFPIKVLGDNYSDGKCSHYNSHAGFVVMLQITPSLLISCKLQVPFLL